VFSTACVVVNVVRYRCFEKPVLTAGLANGASEHPRPSHSAERLSPTPSKRETMADDGMGGHGGQPVRGRARVACRVALCARGESARHSRKLAEALRGRHMPPPDPRHSHSHEIVCPHVCAPVRVRVQVPPVREVVVHVGSATRALFLVLGEGATGTPHAPPIPTPLTFA